MTDRFSQGSIAAYIGCAVHATELAQEEAKIADASELNFRLSDIKRDLLSLVRLLDRLSEQGSALPYGALSERNATQPKDFPVAQGE